MKINQFEVWIADLSPQNGTEPEKTRLVLIVQTNLLNKVAHRSTVVCPITTNILNDSEILRINLKKGTANLKEDCDVLLDQLRAIDHKRLIKKIGDVPKDLVELIKGNLGIILDL